MIVSRRLEEELRRSVKTSPDCCWRRPWGRATESSTTSRSGLGVARQPASPNLAHMPDRLAELRRQRALIAEHLAWLDREIATAAPSEPAALLAAQSTAAFSAPDEGHAPPRGLQPTAPVHAGASSKANPSGATPTIIGGFRVAGAGPQPDSQPESLPHPDPVNIRDNVRRGCFLYVALAALLVVLGGALLVWAGRTQKAKNPPAPRVQSPESP